VIADGAAFVALSGSHITGPVRIASTTGTVDLTGNTVTGAVLLLDNATPFASVVSGNTVRGLLGCSGNTPPPVNDGVPNTVDGAATGQCSGL